MNAGAGPDHRLERLSFFSDAVIAIGITLLIIEIHPPHLHAGQDGWVELAKLGPQFFGFALSFAVIGRFWMGHHRALADMSGFDPRLVIPNLAFLMLVAFMPFATSYMSTNLGHAVPSIFYNLTLTALAALNARIIFIATGFGHVAGEPFEPRVRDLRARALSVIVAALLAVIVSILVPDFLSQIALVTIPLWRVLIARLRPVAT